MVAGSESLVRPPHYPHDGTYADLLAWHLEYWGTRPEGTTSTNGKPWTEAEFGQAIYKNRITESFRLSPDNWLGKGSAPGERYGKQIEREIFGGNPIYSDWREDLEQARVESQGKGNNPRTAVFPDPPAIVPPTKSVPRPTEHFIGRDDERDALPKILLSEASPAILIQGGPGIGKTELTKAIAHHEEVARRFGERRWFVSLETANTAAAMLVAITRAINCDPQYGFQAALNTLRDKQTLLILDNLETPWEPTDQRAATEQALAELAAVPGVAILASFRGRERVGGPGWREQSLEALSGSHAATLFASIAGQKVLEDSHLNNFIDALGGLPLAIDLVARRAHGRASLAPLWREWRKIGTELAVRHGFEPDRLTSLIYSIELSLRPLRAPDGEHPALRLFRFLGVLPAGIADEDVEVLLGDAAFEAVERLCHTGIAVEHESRIDLLPPVREHARRHYQPEDDDQNLWVDYYLNITDMAHIQNDFAKRRRAITRINSEIGNIESAASMRIFDEDISSVKRAVGFLADLLSAVSVPKGLIILLSHACNARDDDLGEADCLKWLGEIYFRRGDYDAAQASFDRSLLFYRGGHGIQGEARCLLGLGQVALRQADYDTAHSYFEEALSLYSKIDDLSGEAICIFNLGNTALDRGAYGAAKAAVEDALLINRQINNIDGEVNCLLMLSHIDLYCEDYVNAQSKCENAMLIYREIGNILGEANCLLSFSDIACRRGAYRAALEPCQEALPLYRKIGLLLGEANCLGIEADIAFELEDYTTARTRSLEALSIYQRMNESLGSANCILTLGEIECQNQQYDASQKYLEQACSIYVNIGYALGEANCFLSLSDVALLRGELGEADMICGKALSIYNRINAERGKANCIRTFGNIEFQRGDYRSAQRKYESALNLYAEIEYFKGQEYCSARIEEISKISR